MSTMIRFEDLEVPALTEIAKEQFEECVWAIEKALKKQLEFGRLLLIVKSKLPHGEWGNWVHTTFEDHKSLRQIQRHMRAAEAIASNPSLLESADSLDGVLKLVETPKPSVEVIETTATVPQKAIEPPKKPVKESQSTPAETPTQKPADTPVALQEAVETTEHDFIDKARSSIDAESWAVGECAMQLTKRYARGRTDVEFAAIFGMTGEQIRIRRNVFEKFCNHGCRDRLRFLHYAAALNWDDAEECLGWAADIDATVAEMQAWRRARRGDDLSSGDCKSETELLNGIEIHQTDDAVLNRPGIDLFSKFQNDPHWHSVSIGHYLTALPWESTYPHLRWASETGSSAEQMAERRQEMEN